MEDELINEKIFIYQHNLTDQWIENIYNQIFNKQKSLSINRNDIIEIDHNLTYINTEFAEYLLNAAKLHLRNSFSLVSIEFLIFFSILYGFIFIFGILSNSLIIYSFYRSKKLRTFRNIFIVNLAISDILLCSICAPLTLIRCIDLNWKLGRILCKIGPGLQTANVLVSALSITAIAVDRWNFIVRSGKNSKKIFIYVCIILIWILAFSITIPSFIVNDEKTFQLKNTKEILYKVCEETWANHNSKYFYLTVTSIFQYILPVVIVGSTNYRICNYLHVNVPQIFRNKTQKPDNHSISYVNDYKASQKRVLIKQNVDKRSSFFIENIFKSSERYSRSKKILFLVFLTFSLCWLPLTILNFLLDFSDYNQSFLINGSKLSVLTLFVHSLAMLSSSLNPVIYGLLNKNFKQELAKLFKPNSPNTKQNLDIGRESTLTQINNNNNNKTNKIPLRTNSNNSIGIN